jgi:hypothetical protein
MHSCQNLYSEVVEIAFEVLVGSVLRRVSLHFAYTHFAYTRLVRKMYVGKWNG